MIVNTRAAAAAVLLAGAMTLGGCATKGFVREQVGAVDAKVVTAEGRLDRNDQQIAELDRTSREALERAQAAGKLAEGKFLYSLVLSDDSVKFPVDRASLSEEAKTRLLALAEKLKTDNRNVYLEIQGHTDATGGPDHNRKLGEDRAEAVRLFMNQQGVALNRMASISYGQEAPVADNRSRTGRAQNRRVVVVVLS